MIGRLNHVAIAVPDLEAAADQYRSVGRERRRTTGRTRSWCNSHFIELPNTKLNFCTAWRKQPDPRFLGKTRREEFTAYVMRLMTF